MKALNVTMHALLQSSSLSATARACISRPEAMAEVLGTDGVFVVYTTVDDTFAALRAASVFSAPLRAPVTLVHFWAVPYAVPIDLSCGVSPIETDRFDRRLAAAGLSPMRRVWRCRNVCWAISNGLPRPSLVFIGESRRWWGSKSARIGRALQVAGHLVVAVDPSAVEEHAHA